MLAKSRDQEIIATMVEKYGILESRTIYNDAADLIELDLSKLKLFRLPPEIGQLTNLQALDLSHNQLTQLPPEIGRLAKLQKLIIYYNLLTQLPPEIGQLTNLQYFTLHGNRLTQLPPEIGRLAHLQQILLGDNRLTQLPPEIGQLTNLQRLIVHRNRLIQLPLEITQMTSLQSLYLVWNPLIQFPSEIVHLTNLREFSFGGEHITQFPSEILLLTKLESLTLAGSQQTQFPTEIGHLTNLRGLRLENIQLVCFPPEIIHLTKLRKLELLGAQLLQLPAEISQLKNLRRLALNHNQLTRLPVEIGQLTNLKEIILVNNQLTQLPAEIGQLTELKYLFLNDNQLTQLPAEIGQLTELEYLNLGNNQLAQLPAEIGYLTRLKEITVANNANLLTPPPEIIVRGTASILDFLRELQKSSVSRYEAKLLVVGEGGTGKSSLLRSLRNETFVSQLPTTHGIEVDCLSLLHPIQPQTEIALNTWDFGGQHIYHATHQFFLTKRSFYLIVWNARSGEKQGQLHFWLETIQALARDVPVLLVATHTDERAPDLNYQLYKDAYPQLVGSYSVSNKAKTGLNELNAALASHALDIQLMGQPWPRRWLEAEQDLLARPEHHIDARTYIKCCTQNNIDAEIAMGTLGNYLHDLGKILYFRDDPVLSNLVVLKPNWVTKAISRVLTDEETSRAKGILSHAALPRIWATDDDGQPYAPHLYPVFLRLMERFDLSYQIDSGELGKPATRSLVPQLLPYQPPVNLPAWSSIQANVHKHLEMRYCFDFIPAGIIPWFIVRTHGYTQDLHWREGVILKYQDHYARVALNSIHREVRLIVWGVQPYNFFTILMNTMDLILDRFEGLHVRREVPCTCHLQCKTIEPCPRYYRYEDLVRRVGLGKHEVECPESFVNVSVPELLYGIHMSTHDQVIADIKQNQQQILQTQKQVIQDLTVLPEMVTLLKGNNQLLELIWRELLRQWNYEMQRIEAECPNIFFLTLDSTKRFNPKNWVSQEYQLYLVCQQPSGPHKVGEGYRLREAKEWWVKINPWLNHLITLLKVGIPMGRAIGEVYDQIDIDHMKTHIDLMEAISKDLPTIAMLDTLSSGVIDPHLHHDQQAVGPALRTLYSFLVQVDPNRVWGDLHKTVTPEGNILWLCSDHRQQYEAKPLKLDI